MLRMRLLKEAYSEIKANDPHTALSFYSLKRMVLSGQIPHIRVGSRYLINMDLLNEYLTTPHPEQVPDEPHGIRPINVRR